MSQHPHPNAVISSDCRQQRIQQKWTSCCRVWTWMETLRLTSMNMCCWLLLWPASATTGAQRSKQPEVGSSWITATDVCKMIHSSCSRLLCMFVWCKSTRPWTEMQTKLSGIKVSPLWRKRINLPASMTTDTAPECNWAQVCETFRQVLHKRFRAIIVLD